MLPAVLLDALQSGRVFTSGGDTVDLSSNVSLSDATRLFNQVRALRPDVTIELGFAQGISALAIAAAIEENGVGTHHVVDPFQSVQWQGAGCESLRRSGLERHVTFHECFPEEIVPTLPRVQFAFIDSSHLFDLTLLDFVLVDKRLDIGGVIGFHDLWLPGLVKALRYIVTNRDYVVVDDVPARTRSSPAVRIARSVARRVPRAEKLFRPELLILTADDLNLNRGMTFVRKRTEDSRDYRHFQTF